MSNEIILNRMFSGEYLEDECNIGHEIINLYKPDKGEEYYLYLLPYGDYSAEHTNTNIDAVLLVRGHNANCLEVLAKATGIERVFDRNKFANKEKSIYGWSSLKKGSSEFIQLGENKDLTPKQIDKRENMLAEHTSQKDYIDKHEICYGGKKVYELFANNTSAKYPLSIFLTFKAKQIIKVKEPFYFVNEKFFNDNNMTKEDYEKNGHCEINGRKFYILNRDRLSGSAGATYFNSDGQKSLSKRKEESKENFDERKNNTTKNEQSNYKLLKGVIDNPSLWKDPVDKYNADTSLEDDTFSFLTITKKEYDELAFSNMFAYYFNKHKALFKQLMQYAHPTVQNGEKKPLNIIINTNQHLEIMREKKNIDLLIESGNHVFVIENKIKSGINGKKHDIYGKLVQDQLGTYMKYAEKEYANSFTHHYLIFSPNYNKIDSSEFATKEVQDNYKIINYSEIHSVFVDYYKNHKDEFKSDKYFEDFLKAIKKHSNDRDKDFEEIMKRKMQKLISGAN